MTYENEWREHGVIFHYSDRVDGEEIYQSNHEVINDSRFKGKRYQIVDILKATKFECTPDAMKKIVRQDIAAARQYPDVHVIIVTDSDLIFGFARMYEQYAGDQTTWVTEIFHTMESAEDFLKEKGLL